MRREFRYTGELTDNKIADIWKRIYDENPSIKRALKEAALEEQKIQGEITGLFKAFYKSELANDIAETEAGKDRLYKYWNKAGLSGSPVEVFNQYLNSHIQDYFTLDTYDYTKPAWDKSQSKTARNNVLIDIIQRRLEDPQTIKERTTPGGFSHASEAAKYMREIMGIDNINYDYSDPWTMVVYNQQNQIAGKVIGIFANQNVNNAIASLMSEFRLNKPIAFGDHVSQGLSDLLNPDSLTKELLAASVDAVKDPVLNFLNINTITADTAGMLSRLGYSFKEIGLLLNQPAVRRLCDYCMDRNMADIDTAINNVLNELGIKEDSPEVTLTSEFLEKQIRDYSKNRELLTSDDSFKNKQGAVLEFFREVYADAKEVSAFVTNTKFTASNAVKSTFGGMYIQQDKVAKYIDQFGTKKNPRLAMKVSDTLDTPLSLQLDMKDTENYMRAVMANPFGYEQVMYDANKAAVKALNRYFPYDTAAYKDVRGFMNDLTKSGLDEATVNDVHQHMLSYMLTTSFSASRFNPDFPVSLDDGREVSAKEYYEDIVPHKISNTLLSNKELGELPIFRYLGFTVDDNERLIMRIDDTGALTPVQKEEIRDSWEALFDNPDTRDMARDLYLYSYYKSGFGFGVIGFNHLAPLELKLNLMIDSDTSYVDFLYDVLDNKYKVNPVEFARSFIKSHRDNTKLVYQPKGPQYNYIKSKIYSNNIAMDSFIIDADADGKKALPFVLRVTKTGTLYKPAILVDNMLYIASGESFNRSSGTMTYRLVRDNIKAKPAPESVTNIEGEDIVDIDRFTIDDLISEVFRSMARQGRIMQEEIPKALAEVRSKINEALKNYSEKDVRDSLINSLVEEYKKTGVHCKSNGERIC